ncbi:MAG: penicillin-binding protein 2, partial [Bacteroidales bacterium]|nr:penicillin-binding protein 2 [Bacteroidales bacterium]
MELNNRTRKLLIGLVAAAAVLVVRLFFVQVIEDKYKRSAENNSMVYDVIYPSRGIIYDRNGTILVGNKVTYDIMVTPVDVRAFDTLALARALGITDSLIKDKMAEYRRFRTRIGYRTIPFMKQVGPEVYHRFAEIGYMFPGFRGQVRSTRDYPVNAGGNLLGYVSEVDADFIRKHEGEYKSGDYAGRTGIEAAREKELRGEKGYRIYLRDSRNRIKASYRDGELDKEAVPGSDIVTTIDASLQQYGQELMRGKVGSLVAIEPSTGEILAMVSSPGI